MSKFNPNKYLHKESTTSPWLIVPFILTLILIPLIMGIYQFNPGLNEEYWYSSTTQASDLFLYYKSIYLSVMGGILAFIFVIYRFATQRKFSFGTALIPVYVYIGCIVLSTIFSTSRTHSLHGIVHHFESTFVLLTYCLLVLYAVYFIDNERTLRWFIIGFFIGVALLVLFGIFQISSGFFESLYTSGKWEYGTDFYNFMNDLFNCKDGMHWYEKLEPFRTDWMKDYLYMPTEVPEANRGLKLNFPLGQVYLTLYNPNYIAYFTTLTAPFFATLAFFQKKIWMKIVFALVSIGSILCLLYSQSLSGFISLAVSVVILVIAFRKKIFKNHIVWLSILAIAIVGTIGFEFGSGHKLSNKLSYMATKLTSGLEAGYGDEDWCDLRNINATKDGVRIECEDGTAIYTMDYSPQKGYTYTFTDENGNPLETKVTTDSDGAQVVSIPDVRFGGDLKVSFYTLNFSGLLMPISEISIDGSTWYITNQFHEKFFSCNLNSSNTPLAIAQLKEDERIGSYYTYTSYTWNDLRTYFLNLAQDPENLYNCFSRLATVTKDYESIHQSIFSSSDATEITNNAIDYFNQILSDNNEIVAFFSLLTESYEQDDNYYYYNYRGQWTAIGKQPATAIFDNYPQFASNRGFIWARSIPLMFKNPKNFLIGTGPDTFSLNYPHYDYVNLFRADYSTQMITKPHSLFLQIGVQTGFVSLVAVLALYIFYFISCVKLYWKSSFTSMTSKVSVAILASITGYMISGITNDSTVTYAFVYWGLLGVGIAVNRMEQKAIQEEKEAAERAARLEQQKLEREARKKNKGQQTPPVKTSQN